MALIETYHEGHARHRPDFPKEYMLGAHELLEVFRDFNILVYQHRDDGESSYSSILVQKPSR